MKILLILFFFHLFINVVFGNKVKSVSVMEGDSVTLHTDLTRIKQNDVIEWRMEGIFIAKIDGESNSTSFDRNRNFRNRVDVNSETGDLTIKKMRAEDSGHYTMTITGTNDLTKKFNISCVSDSASDGVKPVSVMNRDSVTLHTGVTDMQTDDVIEWRFGPKRTLIAKVSKTLPDIYNDAGGIEDRLYWNHQKGDLTIRHIRNDTSGLYEVQITRSNKSYTITKRFLVTISGGLNRKSIQEGQNVNLFSGIVETHRDDVILWWFEHGDSPIAKIDRKAGIYSVFDDTLDGRFKGRLQLDHQIGNLTITNTKKEDSGLYHVDSSSSTHTLFTRYSVTVCGQDRFYYAVKWALVVLVIVFVIVIVAGLVYRLHVKTARRNDIRNPIELQDINEPLNQTSGGRQH